MAINTVNLTPSLEVLSVLRLGGIYCHPQDIAKRSLHGLAKVEEVLAMLEELMDKEGLERIHKAEEEYIEKETPTYNL